MSKLKDAIQKASRSQQRLRQERAGAADEHAIGDSTSDTANRYAVVRYNLRAGNSHVPDASVLEQNHIIHDGYSDDALAKYKMFRTRILQKYNANNWTTLAITAPSDGAGKTVTAINLAITLASQGSHNVFLVDLDLRNPSIADYLDLPADVRPITAYRDGDADLRSFLWDVGIDDLVVLANRDRVTNSSEFITSTHMQDLIKSFRSASPNPIVIVDLPPVLTADDAAAISPFVDGMVLVVSEQETPRDDLAQSLDMLQTANMIGVVLNKTGRL